MMLVVVVEMMSMVDENKKRKGLHATTTESQSIFFVQREQVPQTCPYHYYVMSRRHAPILQSKPASILTNNENVQTTATAVVADNKVSTSRIDSWRGAYPKRYAEEENEKTHI